VKKHEGRIEVHSQKGRGTTFTVLLPLSNADKPAGEESPLMEMEK